MNLLHIMDLFCIIAVHRKYKQIKEYNLYKENKKYFSKISFKLIFPQF